MEFKPFLHWVTDFRTNQLFHSENMFRELCKELANKNMDFQSLAGLHQALEGMLVGVELKKRPV